MYKPDPTLSIQNAIMDFTGLNIKQFLHCFLPNMNIDVHVHAYGGKKLSIHSSSYDVAFNIYSLLSNVLPVATRLVLFEKYNPYAN